MKIQYWRRPAVILLWLMLWQVISVLVKNPIFFPRPVSVLKELGLMLQDADFYVSVLASLSRIISGFFCAFVLAYVLALPSGKFRWLRELLSPFITLCKTVPVASVVVVLLIWFGSDRLAFYITFMVVFPNIYIHVLEGMLSAPEDMLEMAKVFRLSAYKKYIYIYRAAIWPHLENALKFSVGMSFKSGVAAEVIGLTGGSIGEGLYFDKIFLNTAGVFAWTFVIIVISFVSEKIILLLLRQLFLPRAEDDSRYNEDAGRTADEVHMSNAVNAANMQNPANTQNAANAVNTANTQNATNDVNTANTQNAANAVNTANTQNAANAVNTANTQNATNAANAANTANMQNTANASNILTAVELQKLKKSYHEKCLFEDLSYRFEMGKIYGIMGKSGCGKTTLLRILAGLSQADAGAVNYDTDLTMQTGERYESENHNALSRNMEQTETDSRKTGERLYSKTSFGQAVHGNPITISMQFQEDRLCEQYSAIENILLTSRFSKDETGKIRRLAEEVLGKEWAHRPVNQLSGGMKRRVSFLRALCYESSLLLLDEPFTGLDEKTKANMLNLLEQYSENRIVMIATHNKEDLQRFGSRILQI